MSIRYSELEKELTPRGHLQQASNLHPYPRMSAHIQNHEEDPLSDSQSAHLALEVHENHTALQDRHTSQTLFEISYNSEYAIVQPCV